MDIVFAETSSAEPAQEVETASLPKPNMEADFNYLHDRMIIPLRFGGAPSKEVFHELKTKWNDFSAHQKQMLSVVLDKYRPGIYKKLKNYIDRLSTLAKLKGEMEKGRTENSNSRRPHQPGRGGYLSLPG